MLENTRKQHDVNGKKKTCRPMCCNLIQRPGVPFKLRSIKSSNFSTSHHVFALCTAFTSRSQFTSISPPLTLTLPLFRIYLSYSLQYIHITTSNLYCVFYIMVINNKPVIIVSTLNAPMNRNKTERPVPHRPKSRR